MFSMNQEFQLASSGPKYLARRRRKRSGSIGSTVALPRSPRCKRMPPSLSKRTISTAHLGSEINRRTELLLLDPKSQIAPSSQMNQTGALRGPSPLCVARLAMSGLDNSSSGSKDSPMRQRYYIPARMSALNSLPTLDRPQHSRLRSSLPLTGMTALSRRSSCAPDAAMQHCKRDIRCDSNIGSTRINSVRTLQSFEFNTLLTQHPIADAAVSVPRSSDFRNNAL